MASEEDPPLDAVRARNVATSSWKRARVGAKGWVFTLNSSFAHKPMVPSEGNAEDGIGWSRCVVALSPEQTVVRRNEKKNREPASHRVKSTGENPDAPAHLSMPEFLINYIAER